VLSQEQVAEILIFPKNARCGTSRQTAQL